MIVVCLRNSSGEEVTSVHLNIKDAFYYCLHNVWESPIFQENFGASLAIFKVCIIQEENSNKLINEDGHEQSLNLTSR